MADDKQGDAGQARLNRLRLTLLLASPAWAVLAGLGFAHHLPWWQPVLAALAVAAALAAMLRPHFRALGQIAGYQRALAADQEADLPDVAGRIWAREVEESLVLLDRAWRTQAGALDVHVESGGSVIEALPQPLLLLDGALGIIRANQAARSLLGRDPAGRDLTAQLRHPELIEAARAALAAAEPRKAEFARRSGSELILAATVSPLPAASAEGAVLALTLADVSAARRMERLRADFIANASHEIRTPVTALKSLVETLNGPARDDAVARARFLDMIGDHVGRLQRLVEGLLSLSRIEMKEHNPPDGAVDLAPLLRRLADESAFQAGTRKMAVSLDLADGLPTVSGDREELEQVFRNLLDNALKYGDPGTAVAVSAGLEVGGLAAAQPGAAARPAVKVAVTDCGPGIPAEVIPRLTERFYRVDPGRGRDSGGTGLGLAIVKHIIGRHRGRLDITSRLREGSTFTVRLPVAAPNADNVGEA